MESEIPSVPLSLPCQCFLNRRFHRYTFPEGYTVMVVIPLANTDSDIFPGGEIFSPQRWETHERESADKVAEESAAASCAGSINPKPLPIFTYGFGGRACTGRFLMAPFLDAFTAMLVSHFDWKLEQTGTEKLKWLPTARPVEPIQITLIRRSGEPIDNPDNTPQAVAHSTML